MENKVFEIIKKHWLAIVLSLIFGFFIFFPQYYYRIKLGAQFQGINSPMVDDELFYLARMQDVADGHPMLVNAYLLERKGGLPQQLFLAEYILAQPLKFFNIDISDVQLVYNFIFPFIIFILTYVSFYLVSKSRIWATMGSVFLLFGVFLRIFYRPVSPQFNFIFWLTQFIFLWLLIKNGESRKIFIACIINLGLLFYIYPYYWTYYLIFLGMLFMVLFHKYRDIARNIFVIVLGGIILGSFYIYYSIMASKLPYFEETMARIQLIYTHFPSGINVLIWSVPVLIIYILFLKIKKIQLDKEVIFFLSGIFSVAVAVNQHLITGKNFEFSSHYFMTAVFISSLALVYLLRDIQSRRRLIITVVLLAILPSVAYSLKDYFTLSYPSINGQMQKYAPLFNWLNDNTESDSVVYANEQISTLVPVYTKNNVFYDRYANLFLMPDSEVWSRFVIDNYYAKYDVNFVFDNERSIFGVQYLDQYGHNVQNNKLLKILGLKTKPAVRIPEKAIKVFLDYAYQLQKKDFASLISQYKLDYFIFEKTDPVLQRFKKLKFISEVYENSNFVVYKNEIISLRLPTN